MNLNEQEKLFTLIDRSSQLKKRTFLPECLAKCELHFGYPTTPAFSKEKERITYTFLTDDEDCYEGLKEEQTQLASLCHDLLETSYELPMDEWGDPVIDIKKTTQVSKLPSAPKNDFNNIQKQILSEIEKAAHSVFIAVAWMNNKQLLSAIQKKASEGLVVMLIVDDNHMNHQFFDSETCFPVIFAKNLSGHFAKMHEKFCIIDNRVVLHGTYNWTNNAEYCNDESITTDKNSTSVADFMEEFKRLRRTYDIKINQL